MTSTAESTSSKEASVAAEEEEMEVVTSAVLVEEDSTHISIWEWPMIYLETSLEVKIHLPISLMTMMISSEGNSE